MTGRYRVAGQCSANVGGDPVNGCEAEPMGTSDYCQEHASADELREQARTTRTWADEHDCDDIPCPTYGDGCPWQIAGTLELLADEREASEREASEREAQWIEASSHPSYWSQVQS